MNYRRDFLKLKIPTLLGLTLIIAGITASVYLTTQTQTFESQAAPLKVDDLYIGNITGNQVSIAWKTTREDGSFVSLLKEGEETKTYLDDRDKTTPINRKLHFVTIRDLAPNTTYQFRIISSKTATDFKTFKTSPDFNPQIEQKPIIGLVLDKTNQPLKQGLVLLKIPGAIDQIALIKESGNFILPLADLRKQNLSGIFNETTFNADLEIIDVEDQKVKIKLSSDQINKDITIKLPDGLVDQPEEVTPSVSNINYDLNGDGKINASDHAIVIKSINQKPLNKLADLNSDGQVDKEDVELISSQITKLSNQ